MKRLITFCIISFGMLTASMAAEKQPDGLCESFYWYHQLRHYESGSRLSQWNDVRSALQRDGLGGQQIR